MARTEVTGKQIKDKSVSLTDDVTGVLPVANGGSGSDTLPLNNVLLGNGLGALQSVAPGASGNVLTSDGTTWVSAAPTGGGGPGGGGASGASGEPGAPGASGVPGLDGQGYTWRGEFSPSDSYDPYDTVSHDGSSYVCVAATSDSPTADPSSWDLVAQRGSDGSSGAPGASGADGASGVPGSSGQPGASGAKGDPGDPGPAGASGQDGASGAPGAAGTVLNSYQGVWDNFAEYGPGDIVTLDGSTYILENFAGWTVGGAPPAYGWSLLASVGATGASGEPGQKGDQGDPGQDGASGQPGASGIPGASGQPGLDGASGASGAKGDQGDPGPVGATGASGQPGQDGASGTPGASGAPGQDGASGLPGATGSAGPTGASGASGGTGGVGATGPAGPSTVADDVLTVQNAADATKQLRFSAASISASTTRTLTVPDVSSTIEVIANRGVANGYASLDSSAKVPSAQLPDGTTITSVTRTDGYLQFYSGATAIGSPVYLDLNVIDGGTATSSSVTTFDGGTP